MVCVSFSGQFSRAENSPRSVIKEGLVWSSAIFLNKSRFGPLTGKGGTGYEISIGGSSILER